MNQKRFFKTVEKAVIFVSDISTDMKNYLKKGDYFIMI